MHSHFYSPNKSIFKHCSGSKLWGKHLLGVTASGSGLAGCSHGLTLKRPTAIKDLKENYGNGPPGREQRHVAQNLLGIWKAHPNTSPQRRIYEADGSDAISPSD